MQASEQRASLHPTSSAASRADVGVVIGRFQPFHRGHLSLLHAALELCHRVVVVVGSAGSARLVKNPFTAPERIAMIGACLSEPERERVTFVQVRDYFDEPRWARAVTASVEVVAQGGSVALVCFPTDTARGVWGLFPGWRRVELPTDGSRDARELFKSFLRSGEALPPELKEAVPSPVLSALERFHGSPHYVHLSEELAALERSRAVYGAGPFVTVDAVVTAQQRVLLVERGRAPGKGLLALPGGFLDGSERLLHAAIRELREETRLLSSDAELLSRLKGSAVFDHPARSQRGRTITHAFHFALDGSELPVVTGSDDAASANWFSISELRPSRELLFEDHFQILDHFLSLTGDTCD